MRWEVGEVLPSVHRCTSWGPLWLFVALSVFDELPRWLGEAGAQTFTVLSGPALLAARLCTAPWGVGLLHFGAYLLFYAVIIRFPSRVKILKGSVACRRITALK